MRGRRDGQRAEKERRRLADADAIEAAAAGDGAVLERNARERAVEHGKFAHTLADLGEAPRPEGGVEHMLERCIEAWIVGNELVRGHMGGALVRKDAGTKR